MTRLAFTFTLVLASLLITACEEEPKTGVIVVVPVLPKLNCDKVGASAYGDAAQRRLADSPAGKKYVEESVASCEEENKRRGY